MCKKNSKMTIKDWRRVDSTDEKRSCLNAPDGQAKFWVDKRLPQEILQNEIEKEEEASWYGSEFIWMNRLGLLSMRER